MMRHVLLERGTAASRCFSLHNVVFERCASHLFPFTPPQSKASKQLRSFREYEKCIVRSNLKSEWERFLFILFTMSDMSDMGQRKDTLAEKGKVVVQHASVCSLNPPFPRFASIPKNTRSPVQCFRIPQCTNKDKIIPVLCSISPMMMMMM